MSKSPGSLFALDGAVALVTGAARGLGRSMALGLAGAGADIVGVDRLPLDETRDEVARTGAAFLAIEADLSRLDGAAASALIRQAGAGRGGIDILVNNAGIIVRKPSVDLSYDEWRRVHQVDLDAAFLLSRAAAVNWFASSRPGRIINIASMLSFQGGFQVAAYTSAKSALTGLTRALANEWASHDIRVNAIAPGYMFTEVTAGLRSDPVREAAVLSRIPAGRWGAGEDLQGAVVFLASDAARYIHGVTLPVDGGWLSW